MAFQFEFYYNLLKCVGFYQDRNSVIKGQIFCKVINEIYLNNHHVNGYIFIIEFVIVYYHFQNNIGLGVK